MRQLGCMHGCKKQMRIIRTGCFIVAEREILQKLNNFSRFKLQIHKELKFLQNVYFENYLKTKKAVPVMLVQFQIKLFIDLLICSDKKFLMSVNVNRFA